MSEGSRRTADPVMPIVQEETFAASGRGITVDAIASGLRQLGAQNGIFTAILEANYEEDTALSELGRLKYLVVLADADLPQGDEGRKSIHELLHKAAEASKGAQFCRCRIVRISPKGQEDPLKLFMCLIIAVDRYFHNEALCIRFSSLLCHDGEHGAYHPGT